MFTITLCHCCFPFNGQASVQETLGKSTQDWEILVHGKSRMVLGRGVGPRIKRNKMWSHNSSITLKEVALWLPWFFSLVTRDNYCGIDQASRVLEQINCAVASAGGAWLLMGVVAGSSHCNVA